MGFKLGLGEKLVVVGIVLYFIAKLSNVYWSLAVFVAAVAAQIYSLHKKRLIWKKIGINGPKPTIFFGNWLSFFKNGIFESDKEWSKQYGKIFGTYMFTQPDLVLSDVDLMKQVLVKDFQNFTNRRDIGLFFNEDSIFAKMVTVIKDDEWKNVRNTITPAFTGGKMKNMTYLVNKCIGTLLELLKEKAEKNEPFNTKEMFGACTMDIIAGTAFGTEICSQRNPDDPFVKYAKLVNTANFKDPGLYVAIFFPNVTHLLSKYLGIKVLFRDIEDFFLSTLSHMLKERRLHPLEKPDFFQLLLNAAENNAAAGHEEEPKDDFISHDIGHHRTPLTNEQIMSQSFLFLIAGYETIAVTLTWVAYMLAMNPDIQEQCYEEIKSATGDQEITYHHIQHDMPYLESVLAETLRLFPPAVRFDRNCREEYELDGHRIPKDACISIPTYVIHRSEEHYPEPEKFIPERFSPEEKAKRNPLTYLPFGYGPRNCIGMRFALMEMKLVLANVLRNFKLTTCDKTEVDIHLFLLIRLNFETENSTL